MKEKESASQNAASGREAGGASAPPRVILVSNRLPVTIEHRGSKLDLTPSAGGLATAVWPMHEAGEGLWLGWPGLSLEGADAPEIRRLLKERRLVPIALSPELMKGFYEGFSNTVLWPLFHYFTNHMKIDRQWWDDYHEANRKFARAVVRVWRPGDVVWVHDYHLMLLPGMLRQRLPEARIGFFLHTPFPSSELFRILPWRRDLVTGLLGADVIGFHSYDYLRHFRVSAARVLGIDAEADRLNVAGRMVRLGVYPIGIDADRYYEGANVGREAERTHREVVSDVQGRQLILGVDRMDYTKGIPERMLGYERFLERYPSMHGRVEFLQIGVPTRTKVEEYQDLKRSVDEIVGRVNGTFGRSDWTPLKYLYRPVPFHRLCAFYRQAAVALVTPLRDGMNLVAKEYVATHRDDLDGVLVLSEFAGASSELTEAIQVNPFDPEAVADAIHEALTLPAAERRARMEALVKSVWDNEVSRWAERFLTTLRHIGAEPAPYPGRVVGERRESLLAAWAGASYRFLVLDYDGTLTGFRNRPEQAKPDRELLALLQRLTGLGNVDISLVSGRDKETLGRWFGMLDMTLVAEHGRWLRRRGGEWEDMLGGREPEWLGMARDLVADVAASTPGSFVEEKSASVVWHYRTANAELADLRAREVVDRLRQLGGDPPPDVLQGNKVVEVRVRGVSKGSALVTLLADKPPTDFLFAAGDDESDEELFRQLPASAWSVLVGSRPSLARFSLPGHQELRGLLGDMLDAEEDGPD